jgi:aryl-alcohol dehydrogenase-like predicted oxidoreductase
MTWIRGGPHSLDASNITAALDSSLARLGTDYVDLYQLHWPDRCGLCADRVTRCGALSAAALRLCCVCRA